MERLLVGWASHVGTKCSTLKALFLGMGGPPAVFQQKRGFHKIRGTISGVPIRRMIVFWGLYSGFLVYGTYHHRESTVYLRCDVRHVDRLPRLASLF